MSEYAAAFRWSFTASLLVTLLIEVPILAAYVRLRKRASISRAVAAGVLCSAATLPYLWFVLPQFVNGEWYMLFGEGGVTIAEALILAFVLPLRAHEAFGISLLCNASSLLAGPYVVRLITL